MVESTKNTSAKKVLLAVGAHPDDMDFGASATVAKFIEEGWDAYYVVCTDGSRGSSDPQMTHEMLAEVRKGEQVGAGKILGLKDMFFLDHTDTELIVDLRLKEQLVRIIRTVRPQIVITMDPTFFYTAETIWGSTSFVNHTDHRAAALATMDAVFPMARDRLTFLEHEQDGLKPHKVTELWFTKFNGERGHIVDVSKTFEKKLKALQAHVSQFENWEETKERVTKRAQHFAEGTEYAYAENFTRLVMP